MLVTLLIKKRFINVSLRISLNFSNFGTPPDVYLRKVAPLLVLRSNIGKVSLKELEKS